MNLLDLHCHSTASDGDLPPAELVARAAARGCRILALTDHDEVGGIDAAAEQIRSRQYAEPFKADKRRVVALAIELDDKGKGLIDWKEVGANL